jgi:predicted methyltransferase
MNSRLTRYLGTTIFLLLCVLPLSDCTTDESAASSSVVIIEHLTPIIDGDHRSQANKARDKYRHPLQTLEWFDVEPDMTVVEIFPGSAGWYTEILAPYLMEQGTFYAAGPDPQSSSRFARNTVNMFKAKMASSPLYKNVITTVLAPPDKVDIAPPDSADRVLTFRNVHNWMKAGTDQQVFGAMYRALKPGGILGVVEHRGDPDKPQDPEANSGYVREDYVIKLAEKTGFIYMGSTEINANPKDTKDYPKGVWTLPPTLVLKDVDRDKYLAIGESDRMTLKFMKPLR